MHWSHRVRHKEEASRFVTEGENPAVYKRQEAAGAAKTDLATPLFPGCTFQRWGAKIYAEPVQPSTLLQGLLGPALLQGLANTPLRLRRGSGLGVAFPDSAFLTPSFPGSLLTAVFRT